MKYQTIKKFSADSGYSEDAIRAKIKTGIWKKNQHWAKAPDGRILINLPAISLWVES